MRLSDLPNPGVFTTIQHMLYVTIEETNRNSFFFRIERNKPDTMDVMCDTNDFMWTFRLIENDFVEVSFTFPSEAGKSFGEKHTRPFGVFHFSELNSMVTKIKYVLDKNKKGNSIYPKANLNGVKDESTK